MKTIPTSAKPFIEQLPKKDLKVVRDLEKRGYVVTIHWTSTGWSFTVRHP